MESALSRFGRIDILVNNAGRGLVGAVEETSKSEVRSLFAVNVDGLLAVTRAVLPSMRAQRSGRILNLSSVGGFSSWPGWGVYCATKFAVDGLSEAMHAELLPLGIRVIIIEPGPFRTDFLDASSLGRVASVIDDYKGTAGAAREWAGTSHRGQPGDPAKGAQAIVTVATAADPPMRLQLGADSVSAVEAKIAQGTRRLAETCRIHRLRRGTDRDAVRKSAVILAIGQRGARKEDFTLWIGFEAQNRFESRLRSME